MINMITFENQSLLLLFVQDPDQAGSVLRSATKSLLSNNKKLKSKNLNLQYFLRNNLGRPG
jgi:hypothetical protein